MSRSPIFADTSYFIAVLNQGDAMHAEAVALGVSALSTGRHWVTTEAVLVELGNYFSRKGSAFRGASVQTHRDLRRSKRWRVLPSSHALLLRAEARYLAHPDKTWSMTDCMSMEAMLEAGITEAATHDHHFEQAGFRILL